MSMEQNKRHAFDDFCKRLVKNEAVSIHLEYAGLGTPQVMRASSAGRISRRARTAGPLP